MPWEQRGQKRYFYRNLRHNGVPRRQYIGTAGGAAELVATFHDLRRLTREIKARELQAERDRLRAAGASLVELCEATEVLVRTALVAAGYHQHQRGEWRR